jgi:uncharacterized protein (TIGR02453 family)
MDTRLILQFLADLAQNNNRDWFLTQTDRYIAVKDAFTAIVQELLDGLAKVDPRAGALDPAKQVFRIHRDVRFSKNKDPYKIHMGAMLAPGKGADPGCYFHLEPGGKSVIAGGLYQPEPRELAHIRAAIARDSQGLRSILAHRTFRKHFPEGFNHGEHAKVVRGYKPDHPAWDLIRIKSYAAFGSFSDEQVLAGKPFLKTAQAGLRALVPLNDWLDRNRGAGARRKQEAFL